MLNTLRIRNYAVVEDLQLRFREGLTVFTGETGAGKSIIVDALGLVLGDRGSAANVRPGSAHAEIVAHFDVPDDGPVAKLLAERKLPVPGGKMEIRRTIHAEEGRSRASVNERPVPLQALRDLGEYLADIQGQHAHHYLRSRKRQRRLLDAYGAYRNLAGEVETCYREWTAAEERLKAPDGAGQEAVELLRYQAEELNALAPGTNEYEALDEEHRRLAHVETLAAACEQAVQELAGDEDAAVVSTLGRQLRQLQEARTMDPALGPVAELLEQALIPLNEAADTLRRHGENLEADPERLQRVEQRLRSWHDTAQRQGVRPEALAQHARRLGQRLEELENAGRQRAKLLEEQRQWVERYRQAAGQLSERRRQAAASLQKEVTACIQRLGLPSGVFQAQIASGGYEQPQINGADTVEFLAALNPGLPPRPLAKTASGGELSRISLAVHNCGRRRGEPATLVFDEVDAGIGGAVAEHVGQLLRELAADHQVFCITHLPQVASQGHHHLRVDKRARQGTTRVQVTGLDGKRRVEEIARMLGGIEITERTLAHAREMLATA